MKTRDANRTEITKKSHIHQIEITKEINSIENDKYELTVNYMRTAEKYNKRLEDKKIELQGMQQQLYTLKFTLNFLIKDQRNYYTDILKKGIDVRSEGLCWVVKKLIELNAHLDASMFPKNLDHEQVDYILTFSYKLIEIQQLKVILRVLKDKQKSMRINQANEIFNVKHQSKETMSNFFSSFNTTTPKSGMNITRSTISKNMMTIFETINKNEASKENYEQRMEDAQVKLNIN
jgi:hypothetical protein